MTLTKNTISHATNDTGTAPGSSRVPSDDGVGDGLYLYDVAGATVMGNTIESNAGRGLDLFGTTNSTFGGTGTGAQHGV